MSWPCMNIVEGLLYIKEVEAKLLVQGYLWDIVSHGLQCVRSLDQWV